MSGSGMISSTTLTPLLVVTCLADFEKTSENLKICAFSSPPKTSIFDLFRSQSHRETSASADNQFDEIENTQRRPSITIELVFEKFADALEPVKVEAQG